MRIGTVLALLAPCIVAALGRAPARADEPIRIGVLEARSGPAALYDEPRAALILMLANEQNSRGGLLGRKLEVISPDTEAQPPKCLEQGRGLVYRDKVAVLFGAGFSNCRLAIKPLLAQTHIPLFSPGIAADSEQSSDTFFTGSDIQQRVNPLLSYLISQKVSKWVLEGTDSPLSEAASTSIRTFLGERHFGESSILSESSPLSEIGTIDWDSRLSRKLPFSGYDQTAVLSLLPYTANFRFAQSLPRQSGTSRGIQMAALFFGERDVAGQDYRSMVGSLAIDSYFQGIDTKENRDFISRWKNFRQGRDATVDAGMNASYVGFRLWVAAVTAAGTAEPRKVAEKVIGLQVQTLAGTPVRMLANHFLEQSMVIAKLGANGQFSAVETSAPVAAAARDVGATGNGSGGVAGGGTVANGGGGSGTVANGSVTASGGGSGGGGNPTPPLPLPPPAKHDRRVVDLLYATDRDVTGADHALVFGFERRNLTFGSLRVRVPKGHDAGMVEGRPDLVTWAWSILTFSRQQPGGRFELVDTTRLDHNGFVAAIQQSKAKEVLIFVHGFHNSFQDGAFRLAQMVWDTQYKGIPILFSWPSTGDSVGYVPGYGYDYDSAEYSWHDFVELLRIVEMDARIDKVTVIAHSMGNRVVVGALSNISDAARLRPLDQLVLAAADVDRAIFKQNFAALKLRANAITLYASSVDRAMVASKKVRDDYERAGDTAPPDGPLVLPDMDTIDVSAVGNEFLGLNHDTWASSLLVMEDIASLIDKGTRPPGERTHILRGVPEGKTPPDYWRFPESAGQ